MQHGNLLGVKVQPDEGAQSYLCFSKVGKALFQVMVKGAAKGIYLGIELLTALIDPYLVLDLFLQVVKLHGLLAAG